MTEKQKQIAIVVGVVLVAIFLLLKFRGTNTSNQGSDYTIPTVPVSQLGDIILQGGSPITIPGLNFNDDRLQMIGACCADCSAARPTQLTWPTTTNVYNAPSAGPTIYNYINYSAPPSSTTLVGNWA